MNERDELAKVIFASNRSNTQIDLQDDRRLKGSQLAWSGYAADAILAAGYRKPRQVSSVEDVAALLERCIILDDMAGPLVKDGEWWRGRLTNLRHNQIILPATVLHEPEPLP